LRWSKRKRIRLRPARNPSFRGSASAFLPSLRAMSVRVLVVALVVQVLLAGAFIVWAASGFPLP